MENSNLHTGSFCLCKYNLYNYVSYSVSPIGPQPYPYVPRQTRGMAKWIVAEKPIGLDYGMQ